MSLPGMEGTSDLSWTNSLGVPWWLSDLKNPPAGDSILVFLPGKSHGQRNLAVYSPRGHTHKKDLVTKQQFLQLVSEIWL